MNRGSGLMQIMGMVFVGTVILLSYAILPYIGGAILIFFDYAAYGFRWFGFSSPIWAWLPLGAAAGALIGLNLALRRLGKTSLSPKIALWGGSGLACLYLLSVLYCHTMKPIVKAATAAPAPVTPAAPAPAAAPDTATDDSQ